MTKLTIRKYSCNGNFHFPMKMEEYVKLRRSISLTFCDRCGRVLDAVYTCIIMMLREQKFLPDGFEPLCCDCYE